MSMRTGVMPFSTVVEAAFVPLSGAEKAPWEKAGPAASEPAGIVRPSAATPKDSALHAPTKTAMRPAAANIHSHTERGAMEERSMTPLLAAERSGVRARSSRSRRNEKGVTLSASCLSGEGELGSIAGNVETGDHYRKRGEKETCPVDRLEAGVREARTRLGAEHVAAGVGACVAARGVARTGVGIDAGDVHGAGGRLRAAGNDHGLRTGGLKRGRERGTDVDVGAVGRLPGVSARAAVSLERYRLAERRV